MSEMGAFLRHDQQFTPKVNGTALVRYRSSNVDGASTALERDPANNTVRFSYWKSFNWSVRSSLQFDTLLAEEMVLDNDKLWATVGVSYEHRDLEKAYIISGNDLWWDPKNSFTGMPSYDFPKPLTDTEDLHNRSQFDLFGAYALLKYNFFDNHYLDIGVRVDHNTILSSTEPTVRGGYVGTFFDDLTIKALYGQAIQEPTWRELFGAWTGTGANPGLRSERSQVGELSLHYAMEWLSAQVNGWVVNYTDAIISTTSSGQNIGERLVVGLDVGLQAIPKVPILRSLKIWAYYSPLLIAKETPSGGGDLVDIGDLAQHKIKAGVSVQATRNVGGTLLGRCATVRHSVSTNPLDAAGYCVLDIALSVRDLGFDGWELTLGVRNLLDATYFHPGIREGDSGQNAGRFEGDVWVGSAGYFNSLLPQPGRSFTLGFRLAFD